MYNLTKKPLNHRMGKGKGFNTTTYVSRFYSGNVLMSLCIKKKINKLYLRNYLFIFKKISSKFNTKTKILLFKYYGSTFNLITYKKT